MKHLWPILTLLAALATTPAAAQRLAVGGYAPVMEKALWLTDTPQLQGKAVLLEFFHSTNSDCRERIEVANEWADTYNNIMNVVMIAREPAEQVASLLLHDYQYAYVAIDEAGRFFNLYEVPHVPYALLLSPQGEILYMGNPKHLDTKTIEKLLQ